MTFTNLWGDPVAPPDDGRGTGCEYCSLNYIEGLVKVKGLESIKGRKGFIWTQSPGKQDSTRNLALTSESGQLVWDTFKPHGLSRQNFDVQHVVRCRPLDEQGEEHLPTKRELQCCSIFTEEALNRNDRNAGVHLILGEVAGKALLKSHYQKDNPFFWYDPWQAYVILAPHPNQIVRQGGVEANSWAYVDFRERLKATAACLAHPGQYGYLKSLDNGMAQGEKEALALENIIRAEAAAGRRVSVDIEDGVVNGEKVILMVGFGWGEYEGDPKRDQYWKHWKGKARSVILDHPKAKFPEQRAAVVAMLKRVLEEEKIKKVFQHGSYDVDKLQEKLGVTLRGYDYDTQYAAYIYNSSMRKYGLERLVRYWFMEFMDYKQMVAPWKANFAEAPLEELALYNCGDCHLTKRIELLTAPRVKLALLHVYINVAFVLDSMEGRGPILDRQAWQRLMDGVPKLLGPIERQLRTLAEDQAFNPGAPAQVATLIYDTLGLPELEEMGRGTKEEILQTIGIQTGSKAPKLVLEWRALSTLMGTFLIGYDASAKAHDGEVRTIWWITGASSGRLRSGRSGEKEREGIINFQNIHGNPMLKNVLVSDLNWRKARDWNATKKD